MIKLAASFFVMLFWFAVFSIYNAGANPSACDSAFEHEKTQNLKVEPFRSLRDEEIKEVEERVKEVEERVNWLVSLGFSSQEASKMVIHDLTKMNIDSAPLHLLKVSKLTPKRQLRFEELKQYITWLVDLGFSGREALEVVKLSEPFELRFTKLTPRRQSKLEKIKSEINRLVERFNIPVQRAAYIAVHEELLRALNQLSKIGFTDSQVSKIIKLDILKSYNLFMQERMSIEQKRDLLRQAGFTEKEINRIPTNIMQITIGEIIAVSVGYGYGYWF